jgi:hypothetical protein
MELHKYKKAIQFFSEICNSKKRKEKYLFVGPLRKAGLTMSEIKSLGYKISKRIWKSCLDEQKRNQGIH